MVLTALQTRTIHAIVNIFETSTVLGDYSEVTLIPGDSGQLTFGRSQTTLTSGGLHDLIGSYCANESAVLGHELSPFLQPLEQSSTALNADRYFHNLLRCSADDPIMRATQDEFFDERYWRKAESAAEALGSANPSASR